MGNKCEICGKVPMVGNNVSHANNKSKRRWFPNLQSVRVVTSDGNKKIKVCTRCIKAGKIKKAVS